MSNNLIAIERALTEQRTSFVQVLPPGLTADRLIRTVLVSIERLPQLAECSQQSILNAAMSAAVLGLEVDGVTGQAYLLPFKGRAQLVIGYKGYNTLAARAGITITASVVRQGDVFEWEKGTNPYIKHRPALQDAAAQIVAAYAIASATNRPPAIEVMSIDELRAVRDRAPGSRKPDSPWNDPRVGFPAMCEKTVRRRLARTIPVGTLQLAAALDDAADMGRYSYVAPDGLLRTDAQPVADGANGDEPAVSSGTIPALRIVRSDGSEMIRQDIGAWSSAWLLGLASLQERNDLAGLDEALRMNEAALDEIAAAFPTAVREVRELAAKARTAMLARTQ